MLTPTTAAIQWFYKRGDRWEPFGETENVALEEAFMNRESLVDHSSFVEILDFGRGVYPAYVDERVQYNHEAGSKRDILRGSWFFQRSDGSLCPFTEIEAYKLEVGFPAGKISFSANRRRLCTGTCVRFIPLSSDNFVDAIQVNLQSKSVRWVTPAYEPGHLPRREVKPLIDACWASTELSCFLINDEEKVEENNTSNNSSGFPTPREEADQMQKVRWWWRDIGMGTWQAFSFEDSREIEKAWKSGNPTEVVARDGMSWINIKKCKDQNGNTALRARDALDLEYVIIPWTCFPTSKKKPSSLRVFGFTTGYKVRSILTVQESENLKFATNSILAHIYITSKGRTRFLAGACRVHMMYQQHRRVMRKYQFSSNSLLDKEQAACISTLDGALAILYSFVKDKANGSDSQVGEWCGLANISRAVYDSSINWRVEASKFGYFPRAVDLGKERFATISKSGGFVQVRKDSGTRRLIVQGYYEGNDTMNDLPDALLEEHDTESLWKLWHEGNDDQKTRMMEPLLLRLCFPKVKVALKKKILTEKDFVVNYCKIGNSPQTVLFLHGFGTGLGVWLNSMAELCNSATVFAIDLPGHGLSSRPDFREDGDAKAAENYFLEPVEMWIKEMCGDGEPLETFAIVGHGLGAYLAARLACKQPDRVKKVVLVEPWGMGAPKASEADVRLPQKSMPSLFPSYFVNNESTSGAAMNPQYIRVMRSITLDKLKELSRSYLQICAVGRCSTSFSAEDVMKQSPFLACKALSLGGRLMFPTRPLAPQIMGDKGYGPGIRVPVTILFGDNTILDASASLEC
ncbi:hypothetical protein GUITHDRAFT_140466 [Guillardia theta CCMP2712]|uniref:WWE domain-containing protein n=1 Tax=Guillardia theta (strain CCMP2712) TaxID=905079 RepID=L1J4I9_GUITC|nr:hypothetical protein GUITHDRAFT_140466 [Guillardia theta CCMP2712]EKX43416.1 hypothetical protein GUITHDRAFT_140466 [Guillardia theta CCMP2712]|eukprot:XP_005830396.1 hypothetical protein GUITHDRAFT_140466 [Guillardia theta CCMP2712]